MDLIKHTTEWVEGEILQGKTMIVLGILLIAAFAFILKNDSALLKGMLAPSSLIMLIFLGYGTSQLLNKPKMLNKVTSASIENSEKAINEEIQRLEKDIKVFTTLKIVWAAITIIGIALFYTFSSDTYKGIALGLLFFGSAAFMTDSLLHHRALEYYNKIVPVEHQQKS